MRLTCPSRALRIIAPAPGRACSSRRGAAFAFFVLLTSSVFSMSAAAQSETVVVPVPLPTQEPAAKVAQPVDPVDSSGAAQTVAPAAAGSETAAMAVGESAAPSSVPAPEAPVAEAPPVEIDPTLLYQVDVPVRDQSNGARREAGREALGIVLKRLTGLSAPLALPAVAVAGRDPESFFARFGYQTGAEAGTQALRVQFSPPALFELIRSARLPVWPSARPVVRAWVLRDGRTQAEVSDAARDSQLFAALVERSRHWGLPLEPVSPDAAPADVPSTPWEPVSLSLRPAGAEPVLPQAVAGIWDLPPDELRALFLEPSDGAASEFVAVIRLSAPAQEPTVTAVAPPGDGAAPVNAATPVVAEPGAAPAVPAAAAAAPVEEIAPIEPSSWRAELLLYAPAAPPVVPARGVFEAATPDALADILVDQIVFHQLARFQVAAGAANAQRVTVLGVRNARDLGAVLARLEGVEVVDDVRLTEAVGERLEFLIQTSAPRDQLKALLTTDGRFASEDEPDPSSAEGAALSSNSGLRLRWTGV